MNTILCGQILIPFENRMGQVTKIPRSNEGSGGFKTH